MAFTPTFVNAAVGIANWLNPVTSGPSAPLAAGAALDSSGPSLMPRNFVHQGVAGGLAVLSARAVGSSVDSVAVRLAPEDAPLAWRLAVRGLLVAAGAAVAGIQEEDDESTGRASLRTAGRLVAVGAVGGIIHEIGEDVSSKTELPLVPIATGLGGFAFVASRWARELETRNAVIERWTEDDKPADLARSILVGTAVSNLGRGAAAGFRTSRSSLVDYLGHDPANQLLARSLNIAAWTASALTGYRALVQRLAKLNSKVEDAFSELPSSEFVSGGPKSISPFDELGLQGRRFVHEAVPRQVIEQTLEEEAVAEPIRVYVGVESEPIYATARSELALDEMERLGAFDRKYLLLLSPTGTGWVDHTVVESAEVLARGDIATVAIQYGKAPSFVEVQNVSLGRAQFRQLLWGVKQRLLAVPEDDRPTILVFGESLGAWTSSDVTMHQGLEGFDHYGIDRALWFGLPGLARWSRTGMREGRNPLIPEGTVGAFDRFEQYEELTDDQRRKLRAVVVDHDNDPISQMSLRLAVKRPAWLDGERGRGVHDGMKWTPLITFTQVLVDAMNAMVVVPGEFKSFGHDYRADTARFVQAGFDLPSVTAEQMVSLEKMLAARELDRSGRIKGGDTPGDLISAETAGGVQ